LQEGARGNVIAVEDGDQLTLGDAEGVIDVARFGMLVVVADDVSATCRFGEASELGSAAVVEDIDLELVVWVIHGHGGQHGRLHHVQAFIVGRYENVDCRPFSYGNRHRGWRAFQGPKHLEIADHQHDPGVDLGCIEAVAKRHVEWIDEAQGFGRAPPEIASRYQDRQHHNDQCRQTTLKAIDDEEEDGSEDAEDGLGLQIERRDDDEASEHETDGRQHQVKKLEPNREARKSLFDETVFQIGHLVAGSRLGSSSRIEAATPRTSEVALLVGARSITNC
jgi:hypothetical protein